MVANLQPAKLMGIESQGMVLAASIDGKPVLLHPDARSRRHAGEVRAATSPVPSTPTAICRTCRRTSASGPSTHARERGVTGFLVPATKLDEADDILALCHRHPDVWCALGVHPHDASTWQAGDQERLRALLADPKAVAVGECGLDFYYDHSPRDVQVRVLREQWELAVELGLPVVVHNRDSNERDARGRPRSRLPRPAGRLPLLRRRPRHGRELIDRGFYLGLSGMITFPKADNVREVIPSVPPTAAWSRPTRPTSPRFPIAASPTSRLRRRDRRGWPRDGASSRSPRTASDLREAIPGEVARHARARLPVVELMQGHRPDSARET